MIETADEAVTEFVMRLNGRAWGMALGLLFGLGLFVATTILVLKGGDNVGQHLGLISIYFPGYDVSFLGACIGFVYAWVVGYATGRLICIFYNWASRR